MGKRRYSFTPLNFGFRWRLVVSFTSCPVNPGETVPGIPWRGGWVGSRAGLNVVEKRKSVASVRKVTPALQHLVRHYKEGWTKNV
jgi:hypothetical protein